MYKKTFLKKKFLKFKNAAFNLFKMLYPKYLGLIKSYFLRKTNTFIKSKYSKNRQWSKSIVYFGLWFGVISAFAITYYTYRFLFILSYLWWVPFSFAFVAFFIFFFKNYKYVSYKFFYIFF